MKSERRQGKQRAERVRAEGALERGPAAQMSRAGERVTEAGFPSGPHLGACCLSGMEGGRQRRW